MRHYDSAGIPIINTGGGTPTGVAFSAGGASQSTGTVIFSNSNGVSFGLNAGTVTASAAAGGGAAISAGTQSVNTGTVVFSNSNNITFGMSGSSRITASFSAAAETPFGVSAGTQSVSTGTLIFSNSNNVSFGMSGSSQVTASASFPAQTTQPVNASAANGSVNFSTLSFSNVNGVSFVTAAGPAIQASIAAGATATGNFGAIAVNAATTYTSGTVVFSNSNGVTFGTNAQTITASVVTTYLTSQSNQAASASNGSFAFQTLAFSNGNNVTFGTSAGSIISASVATQSVQPVAASAANGSVAFSTLSFSNTNGVSFSTSAGTAIYATVKTDYQSSNANYLTSQSNLGASASNGSFAFQTIAFSNANNVTFGTSAGSIITASVAAPGAAAENNWFALGGNVAGNTTASGSTIQLQGGNNVTVSGTNGSQIIISAGAGGAGVTLSSYELNPVYGLSTGQSAVGNATSGIVSVWPFVLKEYVSAGVLNLLGSMAFLTVGTSSGRQTAGMHFGIYSQGAGGNSTRIESMVTTSWEWNVTGNNSSYTINQVTSTAYSGYGATGATNSAGVNISSGYTGMKLIGVPLNSLLAPGMYWVAALGTNSTSSINVGISISLRGGVVDTGQTAAAPMGSFSSSWSRDGDPRGGAFMRGLGSWTSAGSVTGMPTAMAFTSISHGITQVPHMFVWST